MDPCMQPDQQIKPIYIVGLGLNRHQPDGANPNQTTLVTAKILEQADIIVGGKAQLAKYSHLPAQQVIFTTNSAALCSQILAEAKNGKLIVVLCSGDPLYFSLGSTLNSFLQSSGFAGILRIIPALGSLQATCAVLGLPQQNVLSISLHGRSSYLPLAHALLVVEGKRNTKNIPQTFIHILTDADSTPEKIAQFMFDRGCIGYRMHVLDDLFLDAEGIAKATAHKCYNIQQLAVYNTDMAITTDPLPSTYLQRVLVLEPIAEHCTHSTTSSELNPPAAALPEITFGLPDDLLQRHKNLLTKQPVRAAGLAALAIAPNHLIWDLGAGSGSVGIEAARLAWQGMVISVEAYPDRVQDIAHNRRLFKAANLEIIHGQMPDIFNHHLMEKRPHRIFIGGGLSGPEGTQILKTAWQHLLPDGRMVCHCALLSSLELARHTLAGYGAELSGMCLQASQLRTLSKDVRLEGMNPVFLLCAKKVV